MGNHSDITAAGPAEGYHPPPSPFRVGTVAVGCTSLVCLAAVAAGALWGALMVPANYCRMTYMRPNYLPVEVQHAVWGAPRHYSLLFYREGNGVRSKVEPPRGTPILYIPGNAGSGRQVRSLAAQAAADLKEQVGAGSGEPVELDFFAVDFEEEFTAMTGPGMAQQMAFVNRCVTHILDLYSDPGRAGEALRAGISPPTSVILVGHSMGGLVARGVLALPTFKRGSVQTILTIATPHAAMPAYADAWLSSQVARTNEFWREGLVLEQGTAARVMKGVVLVSIGAGRRDLLVPTDSCDVSSFCPPSRCLSMSSTTVDGVFQSVDHQASVWCNQLVHRLVAGISACVAPDNAKLSARKRVAALGNTLARGVHVLEAVSYMSPDPPGLVNSSFEAARTPALALPRPSSGPPGPRSPGGEGAEDGRTSAGGIRREPFWRLDRMRPGQIYVWQVPQVPTADGAGVNVVMITSMRRDAGWRLVMCSHRAELNVAASDQDVASVCVPPAEGPLAAVLSSWDDALEVTQRAVEVEASDCERQWNADCVRRKPRGSAARSLVALGADELGPGRFLVLVPPPGVSLAGEWVVGVTTSPPPPGEERFSPLEMSRGGSWSGGAWYAPAPVFPGSVSPMPAVLRVRAGECEGGSTPLMQPAVLHAPADRWHAGLSEGFLAVEVPPSTPIPLWRHQWRPPATRRWFPAALVVGDPLCRHSAEVAPDPAAWVGDFARAHSVRLMALSHASLSAASGLGGGGEGVRGALLGGGMGVQLAVWAAAVAHPLCFCLFESDCSLCGSIWGCTVGGAAVQEMHDEARGAGRAAVPPHGIAWSHSEPTLLGIVLVLAAGGLAIAWCWLAGTVQGALRKVFRGGWGWLSPVWGALCVTCAVLHPCLGGMTGFLLLCGAEGRAGGRGGLHGAAAMVLVSTFARGPSLVGAAKAVLTEVQATGNVADGIEAWLVHAWGKGVSGAGDVWVDHAVAIALPCLCAVAAGVYSTSSARGTVPNSASLGRRAFGALLCGGAAVVAVFRGQVGVYALSWASALCVLSAIIHDGTCAPAGQAGGDGAQGKQHRD